MTTTCACCGDLLRGHFNRRRFLTMAGGAGLALTLQPFMALAAEGNYEAMVLSCIDPRFAEPMHKYTTQRGLTGKFSQFIVAGAAIGVVAPAFTDWHKTFWDNLGASIQLHRITKLIAINHRDCGAAKIAYGDSSIATPAAENELHGKVFAEFRRQMAEKQPKLAVETGLMALDGSVQVFASNR